MLKLILILGFSYYSFVQAAAIPFKCIASMTDVKSQNTMTETQSLEVDTESSVHITLSKSIDTRSFFALYFLDTKEVLLQIIHSDDERKGISTRGRFDSTGQISLSEVNGPMIYRLECTE